MKNRITRIVDFFVLFFLLGAMTGVNVCRFYCNPCGHAYILVNTLPREGKCYCEACRPASGNARQTCCRARNAGQKPLCCRSEKGAHRHSGFEHTFYKLGATFHAEPTLELDTPFCIPEIFGCPHYPAEFSFTFIQENRNIHLIKAPPLEWLCTYLC